MARLALPRPTVVLAGALLGLALVFMIKWLLNKYWKRNVADLTTSNAGLELIKAHEGLRLEAYRDPVGIWTIGYGHTSDSYLSVYPGQRITEAKATDLLRHDIKDAERWVKRKIKVPLTQNQFDALVSHTFNTGGSNKLVELINSQAPKEEIENWMLTTYTTAKGQFLAGLARRRKEEAEMFFAWSDFQT